MSQYGEPWRAAEDRQGEYSHTIFTSEDTPFVVADVVRRKDGGDAERAARIVACVNACEGIPAETLDLIIAQRVAAAIHIENLRRFHGHPAFSR